ncbi:hypothetical protein D3C85_1178190 [compost metagenome]
MNTSPRGISTPNSANTPDSPHRIRVNSKVDTSASITPIASDSEEPTKLLMSCWIRWSGLSAGLARCWLR